MEGRANSAPCLKPVRSAVPLGGVRHCCSCHQAGHKVHSAAPWTMGAMRGAGYSRLQVGPTDLPTYLLHWRPGL